MSSKDIKLGPKDIVFPVMGPTGAGKSRFINVALGQNIALVGHSTTSCTKQPLPIIIDPIPNRPDLSGYRLVLLDTPGFGDTHQLDVEILNRIAKWLEGSLHKGALVGGILYLHDISAKRFTGTTRQSLLTFSRLCGYDAMPNTVLVTTNWPSDRDDVLERREEEMRGKHWKTLIENGLDVQRFQGNLSSAWDVIDLLLQGILVQRNDADNRLHLQIQRKASNPIWQEVKDIVIPVLGPTGSGKSTFVNSVIGTEQMEVGDHTTSCTTEPCPAYVIPIPHFPGYRLVLLDTPGFDDTLVNDVQILKRIAEWLAESHSKGALIGGVVYLHDISTKRLTSTSLKNLETFTRICGEACMKKTVLVTTNWDSRTRDKLYIGRESEMQETYWRPIIQRGGEMRRFLRTPESAWEIINVLLQSADLKVPLLLQEQLVDHQIPFSKTEAGRHAVSLAENKKYEMTRLTTIMDRLGSRVRRAWRAIPKRLTWRP